MAGNKARIGARIDGDESGLVGAFGRASKGAAAFAAKMKGIGKGLGVAFSTAAILSLGKAMVSRSDDIADLAANVGMTTDELQAFQAVAREAGASSEKLGGALEKLAMIQGNMASGDAEKAVQSLEALGLSAADATLPIAELFQKIADGFAKTGNVGALDDLFGRGSTQLTNTLRQIASFNGLDKLTEAMRVSGNILSPGELSNAATLNDKVSAAANKAFVKGAGLLTPGAEDQTAIEQQRAAIASQNRNRQAIADEARKSAEAEKRAELEKIISGAKGDNGIGSELVRIGARGGIAGGESPAVKLAKDQLSVLKQVAENTEPIADISTGTFTQ